MPDQSSGSAPACDPDAQSRPGGIASPSIPEQKKMGRHPDRYADKEFTETARLERDIKTGEVCLIVINALLLVTTVVLPRAIRPTTLRPCSNEMYHHLMFQGEEFLQHHQKSSDIESTRSMFKEEFGDPLRSKTDSSLVR
jgi:hypothetical protein